VIVRVFKEVIGSVDPSRDLRKQSGSAVAEETSLDSLLLGFAYIFFNC
jgi:hypothetical protein